MRGRPSRRLTMVLFIAILLPLLITPLSWLRISSDHISSALSYVTQRADTHDAGRQESVKR